MISFFVYTIAYKCLLLYNLYGDTMFSYIIGTVTEIESNYITIENNDIGYLINTANPYSFNIGNKEKIYVFNNVKEDENSLYGFKTIDEKELFLKLISVKGIGPKMALPFFATGNIEDIKNAIDKENILYLKKFPKIGDKAARQIILDLKGKLNMKDIINSNTELISVLKGLGYKESDYKNIISKVDTSLSIEQQVKAALKLLLK